MKTFFPILLLISLVGRGQDFFKHLKIERGVVVSFNPSDSSYTARLDTAQQPQTAIAWASLKNEVNDLEKQLSDLVFEVNLNKFMIYGINGSGHKVATGLVEDNEKLKKQVDIITELADSLRRISGYYHDALYGSDLFGKGLLIEEFNDHIEIRFLQLQVDSLIKALRVRDKPADGLIHEPILLPVSYSYHTNIADPASAKVIHFNNGCDLPTVRHGKGWARKHKVKK